MAKYRLIFLPGILQSSLEAITPAGHRRVVWDGDILTQFTTLFSEPIALHSFTQLKPVAVIERITVGPVIIQDIYKSLFDFLKTNLKFVDGETFFRFPYDWRQSVFTEARRLTTFIEDLPSGDPIVLLGHSLGTLVVRAAIMEAADRLVHKGVTKVIELAPVHLGSSKALQRVLEVFGFTTLRRLIGRHAPFSVSVFEGLILGLARSMPSLWQLFPHTKERVLVNRQNPHITLPALGWPGWTPAVEEMVRREIEKFRQLVDNIPQSWPKAVRTSVAYSSACKTPYSFIFDPAPPYSIDTNMPFKKVDGDSIVWEWSALWHYIDKEKVDWYHRIIARDPKTLGFLQKVLQ